MSYIIKEKETDNAFGLVGTLEQARKSVQLRQRLDAEFPPEKPIEYEIQDLSTGKVVE